MLSRLAHERPKMSVSTPENLAWATGQITKYPDGRQAIAISPLLWRAQEQKRCLAHSAFEHVAEMLGMALIRALECGPAAMFRKALR